MNARINNSMILEEKISFDEESAALSFKEWLATFGCKAKINPVFDYFTDDVIRGNLDAIDTWCSEMITEDQAHAPLYQHIKQANSNVKCGMQIILEGRSAGDILYTKMDQIILDTKVLSAILKDPTMENQDLSSEKFNNRIFTKIPLSYLNMILEDSNCISQSGDDTILTRDITLGEILNELSIESLNLSERVEYPGLCNRYCYIPVIQYEVIFSLPSHILLEPRTLESKLEELGVHQNPIDAFVDSFSLKCDIIQHILKIIEENTVLSIEELNGKLRDVHLDDADEWGHSVLLINIPVTQQFVFELHKAGYITGNDQKLRIPSKSGKRQRK